MGLGFRGEGRDLCRGRPDIQADVFWTLRPLLWSASLHGEYVPCQGVVLELLSLGFAAPVDSHRDKLC